MFVREDDMRTKVADRRLHTAQRFLMHIGQRSFDEVSALLADDVSYVVAGDHALAGRFSGKIQVASHLCSLAEVTGGTFDAVKWEDWMVGESHVAVLAVVHMQSVAHLFQGRHLFLVEFNVEDQISEVVVFVVNQLAVNSLFGKRPTASRPRTSIQNGTPTVERGTGSAGTESSCPL